MFDDLSKILALIIIALLLGIVLVFTNARITFAAENIMPAAKLVKTKNNPAVYSLLGGKKHLIANESVFKSYGYNWKDIKIISEQELNSYPEVRLVKVAGKPAVYYLDLNRRLKKIHPSENVFLGYGNKWEDIRVINEQDLDSYNDVKIVRAKNDTKVYFLEGNIKKLIPSAAALKGLGYGWADLVEISSEDLESYAKGSNVKETETGSSLPDIKKPSSGAELTLSIENIGANYIPTGATSEFLKINFLSKKNTASITGLVLSAQGVMSDEDVTNVYLVDEGESYSSILHEKNSRFVFAEPITIEAGERRTLLVKASLNNDKNALNRTVSFGVLKAEDIITDAKITSQFPIMSALKQIKPSNGVLGSLEIYPEALTNSIKTATGATDQKIADFKINEISGNEDVLIKKIIFSAQGNLAYTDLINIDLLDENKKVLFTAAFMQQDRTIIFDLSATPLKIQKRHSRTISLRADIAGKESRDFKILVKDSANVLAMGESSQAELVPIVHDYISDNNSQIEVQKGTILTLMAQDSPKDLITGAQNALLLSFELKALNGDIKIERANLAVSYSGTPLEGDVRIINATTKKEIYANAAERFINGQSLEINFLAQAIKAGTSQKFEVRANVPSSVKAGTNYLINICCFDTNSQLNVYNQKPIQSYLLTTKSSVLVISPNELKGPFVAGTKKIKIGSFTMQTNSAEDLLIKDITFKAKEGFAPINEINGFYNIKISLAASANTSNPLSFTFKSPYKLKAGSSVTVTVSADTYPTVAGITTAMSIADINILGAASQARPAIEGMDSQDTALQFSGVSLKGANNSLASSTVNCDKNMKIGSFKLAASGEDISITEITLAAADSTGEISYNKGYANLKLVNSGTKKTLATVAKPLPEFNVIKTSFAVEKDKEVVIDAYVDIPKCCDCKDLYLGLVAKSIKASGKTSKVVPGDNIIIALDKVKVECACQ